MRQIAIYARRSIYTEESESIKMQIDACRDYFKREKCNFETFIDEGFSGSNTDRPSFKRMILKAKSKEFDTVVVYKIDRISRKMVDFINLFNELEDLNIKLISVTEGADPSTPAGKFVMNILASVAEMERSNIQQRVKDNMLLLAKEGRWTGGIYPLGYKSKKVKNNNRSATFLVVDESKKQLVLDIYAKYLECNSLNETTRFINNITNISIASIISTLTSPVYVPSSDRVHQYYKLRGFSVFGEPNGKGYLTYGKRPKIKNKKDWNSKGMIIAVSTHEPLIDEDTWLKVQYLLEKNSSEPKPKESNYSYLNSLVKCARCNSNMVVDLSYIKSNGEKVYSFRCLNKKKHKANCDNGMIMVSVLESYIENYLKNIGLNKALLNKKVELPAYSVDKKITSIKKKIDRNNIAISNLVDKLAFMTNEASKIIISKIEGLTTKNTKLQKELFELENDKADEKQKKESIIKLYNDIDMFNNLDAQYIDEKRSLIRRILKQIYWNKNDGTIEVEFLI